MIEPLVAVELFGIEEMKPELLAAGASCRADVLDHVVLVLN